ncbi:low temperature requirement protein A [Promicromonospora sp. NPDC019610]|uniref:low temperature requirement protein A n=1 Tax=Promicromonospora sp. NPDC019610 TaxID=3364405 RepID=UPI00378DD07D
MSGDIIARAFVGLLRRDGEEAERVTYVELFFDLVFAFAITQISAVLGEHPTPLSMLEGLVVTLAVWWVWVYTAWATNWLDPGRRRVLWLLLVLTATGLVMSIAIPSAFEDRAALFVTAYLTYSFSRTLGVLGATRRAAPAIAAGQARILIWSSASGVFWVAGSFADDPWLRLTAWAVAVVIEYTGPWSMFWIPARGRSRWDAWRIRGGHFSERSALFIIIVLGESILVVGRGLTDNGLTVPVVFAALAAFANAVAMWFLYFAHGQDRGQRYIAGHETTGTVARTSYTYLHAVLVIGLVFSTHGSELALEAPADHADLTVQTLMLLGTAVYLAGLLAFKVSIGVQTGWIPTHVAGIAALLVMYGLGLAHVIDPTRVEVALLNTAVLLLVVIGDERLWRRRAAKASSPFGQAAS